MKFHFNVDEEGMRWVGVFRCVTFRAVVCTTLSVLLSLVLAFNVTVMPCEEKME